MYELNIKLKKDMKKSKLNNLHSDNQEYTVYYKSLFFLVIICNLNCLDTFNFFLACFIYLYAFLSAFLEISLTASNKSIH